MRRNGGATTSTTRMVPIVVVVAESTAAELADIAERTPEDAWSAWASAMERNGWTKEMLTGGALLDGYLSEQGNGREVQP